MDLFTPQFPIDRLHRHFRSALDPAFATNRALISAWADDFVDRDGKFVQEFQLSFNSTFWELYLHAVLKEYGHSIDWSVHAPDFCVSTCEGTSYCIEAVTANAADGKPKEWEFGSIEEPFSNVDISALNHEAMIRLSNAIHSKHKKYQNDYATSKHVRGKPFVLAVAPFEQPLFNLQYNRPIKAVLYDHYVDEAAHIKQPELFPKGPPSRRLGFIRKENGAEIELGFFNDDRMREISAVIFSCTATWGKVDALAVDDPVRKIMMSTTWGAEPDGRPMQRVGTPQEICEKLTDGLQIYHNPFARHPLNPSIFRGRGVVQAFFDEETSSWMEEGVAGSLFFRLPMAVLARTEMQPLGPALGDA